MSYTFERSYYFRLYRGSSSYWLNRNGSGTISSHQTATLYTATGDPDQRLKVKRKGLSPAIHRQQALSAA